jgi:L-asparagine transporter-like permease
VRGSSIQGQMAKADKISSPSAANASASPFVVAIRLAGIKFLPAFINGCILLFVFSAANSDVYIGSRTLFQLAVQGQAPAIFKRVDKRGIPHYALFTCVAFLALSYICVSSSALTIFRYFTSLVSRHQSHLCILPLILATFPCSRSPSMALSSGSPCSSRISVSEALSRFKTLTPLPWLIKRECLCC